MASRPAELPSFVAALARALDERGLPFMLIGGQAVLVHGRPRLTEDIDVTLGADPSRLADVLAVCATLGLEALPRDLERFVRDTFVLPARDPATGIRVDFIFSTTPYEPQAIERADHLTIGGADVPVATAEDLILHKLFAGRARDIEDAESVVRRKGGALDWDYLRRWAREFAGVRGRESLPPQVEQLRGDR
ncbi:MAG: nucleotidyl transferase AbiEii/AbiGii toxin family protein [Gemmatimonadales bacterium]|nr:nucleotidyl transferase AbiEii/AbiGii toxin family protein [Gemmatimonadales bacterium]